MKKRNIPCSRRAICFVPAFLTACLLPLPAAASLVSGTVTFQGIAVLAWPIAGIGETDLVVSSGPGIAATVGGETCTVVSGGSAAVGAGGTYPDIGSLSVAIEIERGGPNPPDGVCLLQLRATADDDGAVSASGAVTVKVTVADIMDGAAIVAPDLVVRQSKTQAGLSRDCIKYVRKQMKARAKCNITLLAFGGMEGEARCKAAEDEPADCDAADYAEAVVAESFGALDQQVDPPSALAIDTQLLANPLTCQRIIGKTAANFVARRNLLVQRNCVALLNDTVECRGQASRDSNRSFAAIDNCVTDRWTDAGSGLKVPDVAEPCRASCMTPDTIDRKCLKDCFELELAGLSDGLVGDVPVCGNGIAQAGEACDDGNLVDGDCCNSTCTPGTPGDESVACADGIDNDCDTLIDGADPDCP